MCVWEVEEACFTGSFTHAVPWDRSVPERQLTGVLVVGLQLRSPVK
jgi:hypothetical protein